MKKLFLVSLLFAMTFGGADAATPWWEQTTVCRLNPAHCYTSMGVGYDSGLWDATSNCWGLKLICGDALTNTDETTPIGRADIARGTNISSDYDTNILNGDCFGARKLSSDGTMVSVNGRYVHVWCNNILDNVDEIVENGEITYGEEPSCSALALDGYIAAQNGKCFGRKYDPSRYYIECNVETPTLIVLNGADYELTNSPSYPQSQDEADDIFDRMFQRLQN